MIDFLAGAAHAPMHAVPQWRGAKLVADFPPREEFVIADLVHRDAPFYDPRIAPETAHALIDFGRHTGLLDAPATYDAVVTTRFRDIWTVPGDH